MFCFLEKALSISSYQIAFLLISKQTSRQISSQISRVHRPLRTIWAISEHFDFGLWSSPDCTGATRLLLKPLRSALWSAGSAFKSVYFVNFSVWFFPCSNWELVKARHTGTHRRQFGWGICLIKKLFGLQVNLLCAPESISHQWMAFSQSAQSATWVLWMPEFHRTVTHTQPGQFAL